MEQKEDGKAAVNMPFRFKKQERSQEEDEEEEEEKVDSLVEYCRRNADSLVYRKYNNETCNKLRSFQYPASTFLNPERPRPPTRLAPPTQKLYTLQQLLSHTLKLQPLKPPPTSKLVTFDSNFQSGNLLLCYKIAHNEYDLILHNDINTKGNLQWFYFSVSVEYPMEVKFNVINMLKCDSLFNYGMQVAVFSERRSRKTGEGWTRGGRRISYERNEMRVEMRRRWYYTLSFSYEFKSEDKVYFAHSYPYTYSRLNQLLFNVCNNPIKGKFCKRQILGSTLMGLNLQCLTLSYQYSVIKDTRKLILILARQHPGETVGSWVAEGFIEQIVKKTKESEYLRKNYLVKVIPMVNPDGVAIGNYRTNLAGGDLNRNWGGTERRANGMFPEVAAVRGYVSELMKDRKVKIIIDLHGHSKKMQTFFYGNSAQNPEVPRLFPYLCSKLNPQVNFDECVFTCSQERRNTARMFLAGLTNTPNVYTYQCSFFGGFKGTKKYAYSIEDYKKLGASLVESLYEYCNQQSQVHKKVLKQLCTNLNLLKTGDKSSCSQSNPDECQLKQQQRQQIKALKPQQSKPSSRKAPRNIFPHSEQKDKCTIRRTRNASAKLVSTHNTAEKKQTQMLIEYRKTIEKFESSVNWKVENSRKVCCDRDTQVSFVEEGEDRRRELKPKSRVIKNQHAKILFSIEVKKKSSEKISQMIKISNPMPSNKLGWTRNDQNSSKFVSRGCQTDFKKPILSDRRLSRLLQDQLQSYRSRSIKTASKLQPIKSISQHFV